MIIFSESAKHVNKADNELSSMTLKNPMLEFANISASGLFKIDLETLDAQLSRKQFLPLSKSKAELYETMSAKHEFELNALRAQMDHSDINSTESGELLSLQEIMMIPARFQDVHDICEAYVMLDGDSDDKEDHESPCNDKTLIVKRAELQFNDKSCVVLSLEDISAVKKLKMEEEKSRIMSSLYSMVHHEMLGPLKSCAEAAVRLIRKLKDNDLRQQAQIVLICSKQVILHANDLLD